MTSGTVWILLLLAVVLLLGFYLFRVLKSKRVYWVSRRIPFVAWPHLLFGNVRGLWSSEHSSTLLQRIYRDLKERRLAAGGFNLFVSPSILVVDPDLVQQILDKDAEVFRDRGLYVDSTVDPLSDTLFALGGKQWQEKRARLVPVFSEATVRRVFGTIANVANELRFEIRKNNDRSEIDLQEWVSRYVTHVMGTSVFGIRCRTIQHSNTEFRATGEKAVEFSWTMLLKHWACVSLPRIARKLGLRITDESIEKFYAGLCKATVLHRKSYAVWKDDILQMLILLRERQQISMDELTTQCYTFVKYGLETCTSVMTFCLYELAKNDTIQTRLREEINHSLEDTDGQVTYDVIMSMIYLDQVVNETMRKYPPMDVIYRRSKTTHSNIPKGTLFAIPVYALHNNPDHFPSPQVFDPDRFAAGVRPKTRHPYCYLPFGAGPRGCAGAHFGSLVVKIGLVTLLRSFRFVRPTGDGDNDGQVKFKPNALVLSPMEGTLRLGVERI